jgi:GxxExxY protein
MKAFASLPSTVEKAAAACADCGISVHRVLGPGFKERIYQRAFCLELDSRGITFECEKAIMVRYKLREIPGQKVDLIVGGLVLVEIKAVPKLREIHYSQTISYLRTTGLRLGLLMNFNVRLLKDGLKRVIL